MNFHKLNTPHQIKKQNFTRTWEVHLLPLQSDSSQLVKFLPQSVNFTCFQLYINGIMLYLFFCICFLPLSTACEIYYLI